MTKTPTLRDSADLLDLNAATPPGRSPPVGYGERGAIAPVAPAFTPDEPRFGRGSRTLPAGSLCYPKR